LQAHWQGYSITLATAATYALVSVGHTHLEDSMEDHHYDMNGSDVDAEGEDDVELDYSIAATPTADAADEEGFTDDEDASGEELDAERDGLEDEDDNEEDFVGAVKLPDGQGDSDEDAMAEDEEDGIEASEDEEEDDDDAFTKNSESAESAAAEQQWEGESDGGEDVQSEVATRNNCV
jgi:histone acetyltransferase SAS3